MADYHGIYVGSAYEYLRANAATIKSVAGILNVNPMAIAAAIAEEQSDRTLDFAGETLADILASGLTHEVILKNEDAALAYSIGPAQVTTSTAVSRRKARVVKQARLRLSRKRAALWANQRAMRLGP